MAEDRPPEERQHSGEPGAPENPLIAQDELDKAIAEAQEAIHAVREAAKAKLAAMPSHPAPEPGPPVELPPDRGILKQDELDHALREPAAVVDEHPVAAGGAETVDQDEIELLLRSVHSPVQPAMGVGGSSDADEMGAKPHQIQSLISQEELDAAMADADSRRKRELAAAKESVALTTPLPAPPAITLPPDMGAVTQDELDQVIRGHAGAAESGSAREQTIELQPQPPADAADTTGQDDIDRLLEAVNEGDANLPEYAESVGPATKAGDVSSPIAAEATTPPESIAISQDEIDRILRAGDASPATTASNDVPPLEYGEFDQDAVDRLIREAAEQAAADGLAATGQRHDPPDSVIVAPDSTAALSAPGAGDAESLAQNDIDALLASLTGPESDAAPPESTEAPRLSQTVPIDNPPQPGPDADRGEQLSQADLDQLLAGASEEETLNNQHLDDPLIDEAAVIDTDPDAEVAVSQDANQTGTPEVPSLAAVADVEDLLTVEDPVERAARGAAESEVGSENLAAAAPQLDDLLESITRQPANVSEPSGQPADRIHEDPIPSSEELSREIADAAASEVAHGRDDMVVQLGDEELADVDVQAPGSSQTPRKDFRRSFARDLKRRAGAYVQSGSLKTWGSLAAGLLCAVATFLYLQSNRQRMPDLAMLSTATPSDLGAVVRSARELIAMEKYEEARTLLEPVVLRERLSPSIAEAQCLYIESRFHQLPAHITDQEAESLHRDIDELVAFAPGFRRNPELLRWKAGLYERSGALAAALSTYKRVADEYADTTGGDVTLLAAARLAGDMKRREESEQFLVKLLQRFPASPYAPEAKLLLGDAQRELGMLDDARKLYTQVAFSQDFSPVGAKATARLAELELDQGNYSEAIAGLERRLETATTVEGNDAIYLLLAKAYRGKGDLDKAETILRELISFFPESEHTAGGFVELSQTLEATGNRREALKIAAQASQRYPENPAVLINEGEMLQRSGDDGEAARAFLKAVETGTREPRTLLATGHALARANELAKARQTYDRLLTDFPTAPEAFEGSIALAKVMQKQGQSQAALDRLTNLADASTGRPQQVSLLLALGELYGELGFRERAAQYYEDAAAVTSDASVLATSAVSLIDTGNSGPGLSIARRVDISELPPDLGYRFLMGYGKALLQMDTAMALEKMEQAYAGYPEHRTEEGDRALLHAYLVTGQTARARALVMDLSGYVRSHPDSGPRLLRTATQWADALFGRGDYTAAAEAYALAVEAAPEQPDADWARFQQANALMKLDEYGKSLELLETVAESSSPYADDARLKADYARLEQRLRGAQMPAQMGG